MMISMAIGRWNARIGKFRTSNLTSSLHLTSRKSKNSIYYLFIYFAKWNSNVSINILIRNFYQFKNNTNVLIAFVAGDATRNVRLSTPHHIQHRNWWARTFSCDKNEKQMNLMKIFVLPSMSSARRRTRDSNSEQENSLRHQQGQQNNIEIHFPEE